MALTDLLKRITGRTEPETRISKDELEAAYKDSNTGLLGQAYIEKIALTNAVPKNVNNILLLDIAGMNEINRQYGRVEGDKVIRVTAQVLSGVISKKGQVLKYKDNKFLLLLNNGKDFNPVMEQANKKLEDYYQRKLAGMKQEFTMSSMYVSNNSSFKEELTKAEDQLKELKLNKCRIKSLEKQKSVAIIERRDELALYLRYLLGQTTIESKEHMNILFGDIEYDQKQRMEKHAKIIRASNLEVIIFMSYQELAEVVEWSDYFGSVIFYKMKDGDKDASDLIREISAKKPEISYVIPFANSTDSEIKAIVDKIKADGYPVLFANDPDMGKLLQVIKLYDLKKLSQKQKYLASSISQ